MWYQSGGGKRTNTGLLIAFIGVHESHLTFAAERSWIIQTLSVIAKSWVVGAFIDVLANGAVAAETGIADALQNKSGRSAPNQNQSLPRNSLLHHPKIKKKLLPSPMEMLVKFGEI